MQYLSSGQNIGLGPLAVTVACGWRTTGGIDADVSALLLDTQRRVRGDFDFVFYNQPASVDDTVQHAGKQLLGDRVEDRVSIDLASVTNEVHVIAVVLSVEGDHSATIASLPDLEITVADTAGHPIASFVMPSLTTETAVVTVEMYRRDAGWKMRAVGQGYHDGLAGLARDFGVTVDDDPSSPEAEVAPVRAPLVDWTNPPVPAGYEI